MGGRCTVVRCSPPDFPVLPSSVRRSVPSVSLRTCLRSIRRYASPHTTSKHLQWFGGWKGVARRLRARAPGAHGGVQWPLCDVSTAAAARSTARARARGAGRRCVCVDGTGPCGWHCAWYGWRWCKGGVQRVEQGGSTQREGMGTAAYPSTGTSTGVALAFVFLVLPITPSNRKKVPQTTQVKPAGKERGKKINFSSRG